MLLTYLLYLKEKENKEKYRQNDHLDRVIKHHTMAVLEDGKKGEKAEKTREKGDRIRKWLR